MKNGKRKLSVTCGLACLLKDREGILDNYDSVSIVCGRAIISSEINAKLSAMGAEITSGGMHIQDIKGDILQLDEGAVIDADSGLNGFFVIAKNDLVVKKEGMKRLGEVDGLIALGTIYYPDSANLAALAKVSGNKRPYPQEAQVVLGNHPLESLLANFRGDKAHIWVSGGVTALDKKALQDSRSRSLTISCSHLLCYDNLNAEYGDLITCTDRTLVPDGYEITGEINGPELALYGPRIYVNGNLSMEEKDIPSLETIESVIVNGKASLPAAAVAAFRGKGKAKEYFIFEGRFIDINGFEQFSHSQLEVSAKKAEKITLHVNGDLVFDDDVTAEDVECIASLSYNGTVIAKGPVRAALASKVKTGNGFMGDSGKLKEMTGQSIQDLFSGRQSNGDSEDSHNTNINLGTYILA